MAELSKFSNKPAKCHCKAIKRVHRYLRQTIDWGIIFWRSEQQEGLPMDNHKRRAVSETDMKFQHPISLDQFTTYSNAVDAINVKSRQSIGEYVAVIAGTAVAYSGKWHQAVSTSSTEADLFKPPLLQRRPNISG
eukprot:1052463-Ditylum_brightwellii.AAC.1